MEKVLALAEKISKNHFSDFEICGTVKGWTVSWKKRGIPVRQEFKPTLKELEVSLQIINFYDDNLRLLDDVQNLKGGLWYTVEHDVEGYTFKLYNEGHIWDGSGIGPYKQLATLKKRLEKTLSETSK